MIRARSPVRKTTMTQIVKNYAMKILFLILPTRLNNLGCQRPAWHCVKYENKHKQLSWVVLFLYQDGRKTHTSISKRKNVYFNLKSIGTLATIMIYQKHEVFF